MPHSRGHRPELLHFSMRVTLVNQFFYPDLSATAQVATDLADGLAEVGWRVTAVSGTGQYLGGGRRLPFRDVRGDVTIRRVPATSFGKGSLVRRAADYASFMGGAVARLASLPKPDVLVTMTTPPLLASAAAAYASAFGVPLVYWLQDVYPEVAGAFGALSETGLPYRAMAAGSRFALSRAAAVVVLGEAMRARAIAAGAAADRVHVIANWADERVIRPLAHADNPLRARLARGARRLVMYSGNMGRAHDMQTIADGIRRLRGMQDVRWLFVGNGDNRGSIERLAAEQANVELLPYVERALLPQSLSAADVHLIALKPEVVGLLEPSKLYGIMAAGRPSVFVGPAESEVARTIAAEPCGQLVRNGDASGFAEALSFLLSNDEERTAQGRAARVAVETRLGRTHAIAAFSRLLRRLLPA